MQTDEPYGNGNLWAKNIGGFYSFALAFRSLNRSLGLKPELAHVRERQTSLAFRSLHRNLGQKPELAHVRESQTCLAFRSLNRNLFAVANVDAGAKAFYGFFLILSNCSSSHIIYRFRG